MTEAIDSKVWRLGELIAFFITKIIFFVDSFDIIIIAKI